MMLNVSSTPPRKLLKRLLSLACIGAVFISTASHADLFIRFGDIEGESVDEMHENWNDVQSINWGVSIPTGTDSGSKGGGIGTPTFADLSWVQAMDKSFPPLFDSLTRGKALATVDVHFTTPSTESPPIVFFSMTFDDVLLTSLFLSATDTPGVPPTVSGSFSYSRIEMTYTTIDPKSGKAGPKAEASFDLLKGTGSAAALAELFVLGLSGPGSELPAAIPLPAAFWLFSSAVGACFWRGRRKRPEALL